MNKDILCKNLEKRGFTPHVFPDRKAAADYLVENIRGTTVGIGGSVTVQELDIYDRLAEHNTVHWNWRNPQPDTRQKAAASPVFLTSANGVSETGELVNIDGVGNRVAPTLFGPEKVYFIIGQNKVEPDLHSAVHRARNVAGPLNARRLKKKTPCAMGDEIRCFDCSSPDRICQGEVILLGKPMGMKECHVIIVEEDLGY